MPELPEVETTIKGLKSIIGSTVLFTKTFTLKLRFIIPKNIASIKKAKITNLKRKGKFIIIYFNNNKLMVFHLGMSGRIRLFNSNNFVKQKHDHFFLMTDKKKYIVFNDPRKFGSIDYGISTEILKKKYITNLGVDALSNSFNGDYLYSKINKSEVQIKQILLNQSVISGIGNIYASEILFDAKISPFEIGQDIDLRQCYKIEVSTKKILKNAIKSGGSSIKNFVSSDGTLGNFQNNFKVYNKESKKIHGGKIVKTKQYGRSTYYCPQIQKKCKK